MSSADRQRLLMALILLVMAAFVASGVGAAGRWRRYLRAAALIGFAAAVLFALVEIGLWWMAAIP